MSEIKISALSFVYNEVSCIENALKSIRPYVDEIILVDGESTDNTRAIASKYADKVFIRPWQLCGDSNKEFLHYESTGNWILWFYGDEVFPEKTASNFKNFIEKVGHEYSTFSFMRREWMDGKQLKTYGMSDSQNGHYNYQSRLHRKCENIFYTGLVHAEVHFIDERINKNMPMPPEYYMEHHKTSVAQEFDNIRLYVWYKYSIWRYGNTNVMPFKKYADSYKQIVHDSEAKNLSGERDISLAEEFWQDWRKYADMDRITLKQFKDITGMEYAEFLEGQKAKDKAFTFNRDIVDRAIKEMGEKDEQTQS